MGFNIGVAVANSLLLQMSAAWFMLPLGSTSKVLHSWSNHSETQNKMFPVEYIISACVQLSEEGHKVLFRVLQMQIDERKYEKTWILPVLLGAYPPVHLTTELGSYTPSSFGVSSVVSVSFSVSLSLSLSLRFSSPWSHTIVSHMMPQNVQTETLSLCLVILVDYFHMFNGLSNMQYGSYMYDP